MIVFIQQTRARCLFRKAFSKSWATRLVSYLAASSIIAGAFAGMPARSQTPADTQQPADTQPDTPATSDTPPPAEPALPPGKADNKEAWGEILRVDIPTQR